MKLIRFGAVDKEKPGALAEEDMIHDVSPLAAGKGRQAGNGRGSGSNGRSHAQ